MRINTLFALICFSLLATALVAQTPSPIPEEARKHFVMGTTLFKDAKTADDYAEVVSEFKQTMDLAPLWPEARYNLALAREAAGDYSGAMEDLKLYQKFKLSDTEARTIQDKIYALEAKAELATKKLQTTAATEQQKARDYQDNIGFLSGEWDVANTMHCGCGWNGQVSHFKALITIKDKNVVIIKADNGATLVKGTIEGDDYTSIKWVVPAQDGLADYSLDVKIDKGRPQISLKIPSRNMSVPPFWSWESSNDWTLTH